MSQEINVTQQIRVNNGNHIFPSLSGSYGASNQLINQLNPGGPVPGTISAVTAANGTLVDLSTFAAITATGGWIIFKNTDPTNFVTWGVDNGSGTIVKVGEMLPGEIAGPFRMSRSQQKYRFQADTLACDVDVFAFVP